MHGYFDRDGPVGISLFLENHMKLRNQLSTLTSSPCHSGLPAADFFLLRVIVYNNGCVFQF
jgi:hypothetical protein